MLPQVMIDVDRYPLEDLDSTRGRELIARCRQALDREALCRLPGFIVPQALAALVEESTGLEAGAFAFKANRCAYVEPPDDTLPAGHPRNRSQPCRYRQVLTDQIPGDSQLRRLYAWPVLTGFVRRLLGVNSLYRSACPHLSLTLQMARHGDANGWHFDGNDFVVSILLQEPDEGGEFEYAPYVRTLDDQCYDAVSRVMDNPDQGARRPPIEAGTFTLFKGDLSLHRVRTIGPTQRPRIIALFSYDERPGQVFPPDYVDELRGMASAG